MAGRQKLSSAEVTRFENAVDEIGEHLEANLKKCSQLIATAQAGWTGSGSSSFQSAQRKINDDHLALRRLLAGIQEAVVQTHKVGRGNDQSVVDKFRGIDVNGSQVGGHLTPSKLDSL